MIKGHFIIPLVVYPFDVMVSVNETDAVLLKRLKQYGNPEQDCECLLNLPWNCRGRAATLSSNQTVIRLKRSSSRYEMISIITHEVFHATTFILDRVGMKMEIGNSDEAYAYLIQYLTKEISRKMKI